MKNLIVFMVLVPSIAMAQFKGTYETLKIREVWYLCFHALTEHRRDIPRNDHALTCDCYIDKLRIQYTFEEFNLLDPQTQYQETFRFTSECLRQLNPSIGDHYG